MQAVVEDLAVVMEEPEVLVVVVSVLVALQLDLLMVEMELQTVAVVAAVDLQQKVEILETAAQE